MKPTPLLPAEQSAVQSPANYVVSTFMGHKYAPKRRTYPFTRRGLNDARTAYALVAKSILFIVGTNGQHVPHNQAYPNPGDDPNDR